MLVERRNSAGGFKSRHLRGTRARLSLNHNTDVVFENVVTKRKQSFSKVVLTSGEFRTAVLSVCSGHVRYYTERRGVFYEVRTSKRLETYDEADSTAKKMKRKSSQDVSDHHRCIQLQEETLSVTSIRISVAVQTMPSPSRINI